MLKAEATEKWLAFLKSKEAMGNGVDRTAKDLYHCVPKCNDF